MNHEYPKHTQLTKQEDKEIKKAIKRLSALARKFIIGIIWGLGILFFTLLYLKVHS